MAEAPSSGPSEVGPVLITGASGFLGSALVDVFRRAGFPVRILVRASSPRRNLTRTAVEIAE
ncbi:NmrA family NAD(P)-binding protein, partial [Methylobacterium organophilum]|nr:NmrA family NAD(P)-binding protein [Methylobacterium organophilum]